MWCTCRTCAPRSLEVSTDAETAVCNLGSVNLARHLTAGPDGTLAVELGKAARHGA